MNKSIFSVTLLLIITALAVGNPDPERKLPKELNLTDAQKEQFEKISYETQKKQIEIKAKLETAQLDMKRLMNADNIDKSAIEKKLQEIASYQVALKMNHINGWSEKNKQLTAEQQKIWKKMFAHQRSQQRKGHAGGPKFRHPQPQMMERKIERQRIND